MKILTCLFSFLYLTLLSSSCFSDDSLNVILIPDPTRCHHHVGFEILVHENNTMGFIGANECTSDRPTYGGTNSQVENTFRRFLIPWRYSMKGALKDGYFVQTMAGMENEKFNTDAGSSADVTFIDLTLHGGYQWFWANGFNISALAGFAYLYRKSVSKDIAVNEANDVIAFLDKNTKTNLHFGSGIILGWSF